MTVRWSRLAIVALALGCASPDAAPLEHVVVAEDGRHFELENGDPFVPWGFNYDHDSSGLLLEEYWDAEWPTVVEDFREMGALGANVVRVHLQVGAFLDGPDAPNEAALDRLAELVALAEAEHLHLDLTGLGCYRAELVPAWYDALDEAGRWAAQARFWGAIAERVGASPAIFAYDLMNEPVVPGATTTDWLPGDPLGGFSYVQNITRDPAGRTWQEVMRSWIRELTLAIRAHDAAHPITVGFLPLAGFAEMGAELDQVSVHVYPTRDAVDASLLLLEQFGASGRPVVVEETFHLNSGIDDLRDFLVRSRDGDLATGWIGFYWGTPPDELDRSDIADALLLEWLTLFVEIDPNR